MTQCVVLAWHLTRGVETTVMPDVDRIPSSTMVHHIYSNQVGRLGYWGCGAAAKKLDLALVGQVNSPRGNGSRKNQHGERYAKGTGCSMQSSPLLIATTIQMEAADPSVSLRQHP